MSFEQHPRPASTQQQQQQQQQQQPWVLPCLRHLPLLLLLLLLSIAPP
jgi:hypothetical protein